VTVIGAAVAVFVHRPAELRHRQDDGVGHAIAEVRDQRRDRAREVVEAGGELPLRRTLVDVGVPAADVGEGDLESDVRLRELRDLAVTTDFRDVFGEIVVRHLGVADPRAIFPGYQVQASRFPGLFA